MDKHRRKMCDKKNENKILLEIIKKVTTKTNNNKNPNYNRKNV